MKTITINKFVAVCNNYLSKGEVKSFTDFCKEEKYLNVTESGSYEFVAEEVNKVVGSEDSIIMPNTTSSLTSDKISAMYASIVEFMVNNKGLIVDSEKLTSNQLLVNITREFASKQLTIPVSKETKENLLATFKLVDENMQMPKSHPKRSWLRKKVVYPALITSLFIGVGAGILGSTPIADNTIFNTGNAWLNFSSWASIGFWAALPLTFITYKILDKATINHYAKKYCAKSNNLELLRELEKSLGHELTLADIESASVDLPVKNLVKEIEKSRAKVIECNKGGWFKRNLLGLKARKQHRNQLHAMFTYAKVLRIQFEKAKTHEEAERINLLLNYMDKHLSKDARTNYAEAATKVFENGDIYAKSIVGKRNQKVATTKLQFSNLVQRISAERYDPIEPGMLFNLAIRRETEPKVGTLNEDLSKDVSNLENDDSVLLEIRAEYEENASVNNDEESTVTENNSDSSETNALNSDDEDLNKELDEVFNSILEKEEDTSEATETETSLDAEKVEAESDTNDTDIAESEVVESKVVENETNEIVEDENKPYESEATEIESTNLEDNSNSTNSEEILDSARDASEIRFNETDSPFMKLLWSYTHDYDNMPKQLEKLNNEQKTLTGEQISIFNETDTNSSEENKNSTIEETNATPATDKTRKRARRSTLVIDESLKKHYKLTFTDPDGNKTSTKVKKSNNETEDLTNIGNATLEKISETFSK